MKILSFDVGIVNLAYCIFDSSVSKILYWEVIALSQGAGIYGKAYSSEYDKLYITLIKELDLRKHLVEDIDIVLIEKQPSFNPKMRIIASCLQTYFYIRGIVDAIEHSSIKSIVLFSPKHKLKCYTGPELTIKSKSKSKYTQTKQMGIMITAYKLKEHNEREDIIKLFENSKKKDDLSDCYLQALTYLLFNKVTVKSEKILSNVLIKKQLIEYIDGMESSNGMENIPDILKYSITSKFNISFPINPQNLEILFNKLNMKIYIKKIK